MSPRADYITIPATEIKQSKNRKIYSFVVDGKQIHSFATISRLKRGTDTKLNGYQRPEVLSHIEEIRSYLESPSPMIPNGLVLAFDSTVKFTPFASAKHNTPYTTMGTLTIPTPRDAADPKPGFIVDGQQRAAAIREAQIRQFPMVVTAFITDDIARQTEQFILVNSTKPLPKGLLYELLPYTQARLPPPPQAPPLLPAPRGAQPHAALALSQPDPDADEPQGDHQGQLYPPHAGPEPQRRRVVPPPPLHGRRAQLASDDRAPLRLLVGRP